MEPALAMTGTFLESSSDGDGEEKEQEGKTKRTKIKVAQSKPPTKEERQKVMDSRKSAMPATAKRGKSKSTMLSMIPRNVMRAQASSKAAAASAAAATPAASETSPAATDSNGSEKASLSNNDFRAMLMKK